MGLVCIFGSYYGFGLWSLRVLLASQGGKECVIYRCVHGIVAICYCTVSFLQLQICHHGFCMVILVCALSMFMWGSIHIYDSII